MMGGPLCGQLGVWLRLAASRSVKSRFRSRSGPQRARTPIFRFLAPASRNFSKFREISAEISSRNYVSVSLAPPRATRHPLLHGDRVCISQPSRSSQRGELVDVPDISCPGCCNTTSCWSSLPPRFWGSRRSRRHGSCTHTGVRSLCCTSQRVANSALRGVSTRGCGELGCHSARRRRPWLWP